jgi:hypothetical protein
MYKPPHKNTFVPSQKKLAALDDTSAFPELTAKHVASDAQAKTQLDFKSKLETESIEEVKKPVIVTKRKVKGEATPAEIMAVLDDNYTKWKEAYIEEHGWDEYDRHYRFPNYDYEYFDKLDDQYEKEMAAADAKEREKEQEEDFVTEDYEEYEKE